MNLRELRRITDTIAPEMVVVPPDAADVCPMCRSWRAPGFDLCNNCAQAVDELSAPCPFVVPMSLYCKPSPMRDRLTYYKDPEAPEHNDLPGEVAAIVDRYFYEHGDELRERTGGWEATCVVPSKSRQPPHPFEQALSAFGPSYVEVPEVLLERHTGEVGHRKLSDDAFRPTCDVRGARMLILEDVYTTGARSQSAASALTLAGAEVVAIVVVARRVNPGWTEGVQALWDRQVELQYEFGQAPWWAA